MSKIKDEVEAIQLLINVLPKWTHWYLYRQKDKLTRKANLESMERGKTRLRLCYGHRQESTQAHYAEHNCDYCKQLNLNTNHLQVGPAGGLTEVPAERTKVWIIKSLKVAESSFNLIEHSQSLEDGRVFLVPAKASAVLKHLNKELKEIKLNK